MPEPVQKSKGFRAMFGVFMLVRRPYYSSCYNLHSISSFGALEKRWYIRRIGVCPCYNSCYNFASKCYDFCLFLPSRSFAFFVFSRI